MRTLLRTTLVGLAGIVLSPAAQASAAEPVAFSQRYSLQCTVERGPLATTVGSGYASLYGTVSGTVAPYLDLAGDRSFSVRDFRFTLGDDPGYASSIEHWFDPLVDRVSGALREVSLDARGATPTTVAAAGLPQTIPAAPVARRRWNDLGVVGGTTPLTIGPFTADADLTTRLRLDFKRVVFDLTGTSSLIRGLQDRVSFACDGPGDLIADPNADDGFAQIPLSAPAAPSPSIAAVELPRGETAGGRVVRISGPGIGAATAVRFGDAPATFKRINDSVVDATAPPHAAGVVRVAVTSPLGTTPDTSRDDYTYVVPNLRYVSPVTGRSTGGTRLSIYGDDVDTVTAVTFDGVPGTGLEHHDAWGSLEVYAPAGMAGRAAEVRLVSPSGSTGVGKYTWQLGELQPQGGDDRGGTLVTLRGLDTGGMTAIEFGRGVEATEFTKVDAATATARSPEYGYGPVEAVYADGRRIEVLDSFGQYHYETWPVYTGLTPRVGPVSGGNTITLRGEYLHWVDAISVGGIPATFDVQPDGASIRIVVPAAVAPGKVDVVARSPFGAQSLNGSEPDYAYAVPPTITKVTPGQLWAYTSKVIRLDGAALSGVRTVKIGSRRVRPTVVGDGAVLVAVPKLPAGTYPVTVSGRNGDSSPSGAPTITYRSLTPTK